MLAAEHNIYCEQGATFQMVIDLLGSGERLFHVSESTSASMDVRRRLWDDTPVISLTTENGRISIDQSNGTISLEISASDTAALTSGGVYDLKIVSVNGLVDRVLRGEFVLSKETTR